jgi:transcriptional regulator with XRE-family HTH domain
LGGIGQRLRESRTRWKLTLRDVEERSALLAQQRDNPACSISASWLDRVEREDRSLSATKLIVLASIYGLTADELLSLIPGGTSDNKLDQISVPNSTQLLSQGTLDQHARSWLPESLISDAVPEATDILPSEPGLLPSNYKRGVIGQRDRTLEPMVRAGSIVLIDTQKRTIASRREWNHEFDRPIYFLLTRTGYASGFCELDRESEWLTLVPHPLSYEPSKRWRFRKEIEVIGTVAAILARRTA